MDMGYKWYAVKLGPICEFCYGSKGYCALTKPEIKSCPGLLRNKPEWCPLIELKEEPKVDHKNIPKHRNF